MFYPVKSLSKKFLSLNSIKLAPIKTGKIKVSINKQQNTVNETSYNYYYLNLKPTYERAGAVRA